MRVGTAALGLQDDGGAAMRTGNTVAARDVRHSDACVEDMRRHLACAGPQVTTPLSPTGSVERTMPAHRSPQNSTRPEQSLSQRLR